MSNAAYLEARALWSIRRARDDLGWSDEARAVALATGVLMGAGADTDRARRCAEKVWREKFSITDAV